MESGLSYDKSDVHFKSFYTYVETWSLNSLWVLNVKKHFNLFNLIVV